MGYEGWGANQLLWNSVHRDNVAPVVNDGLTPTFTMMIGGMYNSAGITYADGDACTLQFTSDGKLMVDTELTFDGDLQVDNLKTFATDIADSTTSSYGLVDADGHVQVDVLDTPGYDTGTDSVKTFEVSPVNQQYSNNTLVEETNKAAGTYYYAIDMNGYRNVTIQLQGVTNTPTITIEGTVDPDGSIDDEETQSGDWQDVTNDLTGGANYTADAMLMIDTPLCMNLLCVKVVTSAGTEDYTIYVKKQY